MSINESADADRLLFEDYADKAQISLEFRRWVEKSTFLLHILSDPKDDLRDRVFRIAVRQGLSGACMATLAEVQERIDRGACTVVADREALRLLGAMDWDVVVWSKGSTYRWSGEDSPLLQFARRAGFSVWGSLSEARRAAILSDYSKGRINQQFLRAISVPQAAIPDRDGPKSEQIEPQDNEQAHVGLLSISTVLDGMQSDSTPGPSEEELRKLLPEGEFLFIDRLAGWGDAFELLARSGKLALPTDPLLHRFILCLAADYMNECNPSLTDDVVLSLVEGDDDGEVDRKIQAFLLPLIAACENTLAHDDSATLLCVWLFEILAAFVGESADDVQYPSYWSCLEKIDERKAPSIHDMLEGAKEIVPVMERFPSWISAVAGLARANDVPYLIGDARFRFVVCVRLLMHLPMPEVEDLTDVPSDIHFALRRSKGQEPADVALSIFGHDSNPFQSDFAQDPVTIATCARDYNAIGLIGRDWLANVPREIETLPEYLDRMSRTFAFVSANGEYPQKQVPEFRIPLADKALLALRADTLPEIIALISDHVVSLHPERWGIAEVTSIDFIVCALFCGFLRWLQLEGVELPPEHETVALRLMNFARIVFDAIRLSSKSAGPLGEQNGGMRQYLILSLAGMIAEILKRKGETDVALRPLLNAVRWLQRPMVSSDLRVPLRSLPKGDDDPRDSDTHMARLIHFILRAGRDDEVANKTRDHLFEYLISRFARRRHPGEPVGKEGWDPGATESDPVWRLGYVQSLTELRFNPGGKTHRLFKSLAENDPSEPVRRAATEGMHVVASFRGASDESSIKRALLNAWWRIRKCHVESLGLTVDSHEAEVTKHREVRE